MFKSYVARIFLSKQFVSAFAVEYLFTMLSVNYRLTQIHLLQRDKSRSHSFFVAIAAIPQAKVLT